MTKRLSELLPALPRYRLVGPADQIVAGIFFWAGDVEPGSLYAAIDEGHGRIPEALARGARTILCEHLDDPPAAGVTYLVVPDSIAAMGLLAHARFDDPTRNLEVVGVTGTNGKTSTAVLLHRLFRALGRSTGLLSNIGDGVNDEWSAPRYTTGHALFLSEMMARMTAAGCRHCFMEVSSQGIAENRIEGVRFAGAIFTNLTRDHLDYHGSMAAYAAAKKSWFDQLPAAAFALANADDPRGGAMLADTAARRLTYGCTEGSDYRLRIEEETLDGLICSVNGFMLRSPLLGGFNAYNLAACFAAACELGEAPARVAEALSGLAPVEGRMQAIRNADGRIAIVDYAHTPDAVEKVLKHLRASTARRVITVIGCGGGGDVERRPVMGRIAASLSDRLILTTDNARWEDPETIIASIRAGIDAEGLSRTLVIADRHEAIAEACAFAAPGDVVLIAGKGHERYQEIGGVRTPFDDAAEARAALGIAPGGTGPATAAAIRT